MESEILESEITEPETAGLETAPPAPEPETAAPAAEPVLINRYRLDADTLRASYREVMRPALLIQLGIAAVVLFFAVFYTVKFFDLFQQSLPLLLMVLLLYVLAGFEAFRALTSVNRATKRAIMRTEEAHQVDVYEVTLRFYDTEIIAGSDISREPRHIPYSGFKRLRRGRDVILIRTRSTLVYTLDPACFEHGTEADFWKLMNEKCPNAVPKARRSA